MLAENRGLASLAEFENWLCIQSKKVWDGCEGV